MFKLIDIETGKIIKRAKHVYTLIEFIDKLIAYGNNPRRYKVIK